MRICDRDGAVATEQIKFATTHEEFDLCESCVTEVKDFITNPKMKVVEDKRRGKRIDKKAKKD